MKGSNPKRILVVDDDSDSKELLALLLEAEGFAVDMAANGLEALDSIQLSMPNLILLDMKMPVMDGWEFAQEFRAQFGNSTPIVVISATRAAEKAREIGAAGSVSKPFNLDELIRTVGEHCRQ